MIVVTFDPDEYNFVVAGDDAYFLLRLPGGGRVLFKDRCAHRGSPLHLGGWDAAGGALVCPSHQTRYTERVLRRQGVPLVYRGGRVTAVLDAATHDEVRFARKHILAQPGVCEDRLLGSAATRAGDRQAAAPPRTPPHVQEETGNG